MEHLPPARVERRGAPPWVVTFADLMALLLCFFVLLLAFSEMDTQKFKTMMGSMKLAFGVQRQVKVRETPKGTSVVMREFSPGLTKAKALNEVRQATVDDTRRRLQAGGADSVEAIRAQLKGEIEAGQVEVETDPLRIIIRIKERSSFSSGSAILLDGFRPVLGRVGEVLRNTRGLIIVAGHTDNVPIATSRYRSNWELSASRAVSVVHFLQTRTNIPARRFIIEGHADTTPLAENSSGENRALNRRVEIVILKNTPGKGAG